MWLYCGKYNWHCYFIILTLTVCFFYSHYIDCGKKYFLVIWQYDKPLFTCPPIYLFTHLQYLSIHFPVQLSICPSTLLFTHQSAHPNSLFTHLSVHLHLFTCLSIHLPICLPTYLFTHLSVHPSICSLTYLNHWNSRNRWKKYFKLFCT